MSETKRRGQNPWPNGPAEAVYLERYQLALHPEWVIARVEMSDDPADGPWHYHEVCLDAEAARELAEQLLAAADMLEGRGRPN